MFGVVVVETIRRQSHLIVAEIQLNTSQRLPFLLFHKGRKAPDWFPCQGWVCCSHEESEPFVQAPYSSCGRSESGHIPDSDTAVPRGKLWLHMVVVVVVVELWLVGRHICQWMCTKYPHTCVFPIFFLDFGPDCIYLHRDHHGVLPV